MTPEQIKIFEERKAKLLAETRAKGPDKDLTPLDRERLHMTTNALEILGHCAHDEKLGPKMAEYLADSVAQTDALFEGLRTPEKEAENEVSRTFVLAVVAFMKDAKKFPSQPGHDGTTLDGSIPTTDNES